MFNRITRENFENINENNTLAISGCAYGGMGWYNQIIAIKSDMKVWATFPHNDDDKEDIIYPGEMYERLALIGSDNVAKDRNEAARRYHINMWYCNNLYMRHDFYRLHKHTLFNICGADWLAAKALGAVGRGRESKRKAGENIA